MRYKTDLDAVKHVDILNSCYNQLLHRDYNILCYAYVIKLSFVAVLKNI